MRILYSHRTKSSDGQFVHIRALTEAFANLGHDVLICGPEGVFAPHELDGKKLNAAAGENKGLLGHLPQPMYEVAELAYSIPALYRLRKTAQRFNPDVIYERANLFYAAGQALKKLSGKPLLLEINAPLTEERSNHGGLSLKPIASYQEKSLWRMADHVFPVTSVLAEKIAAVGVSDNRITVMPNGVSRAQLQPGNGSTIRTKYGLADKLVIGFTGFVREWHGVDMALDWLPQHDEAHLLMVGDGPAISSLKARAAELGVADRFHVTGVVQREDLNDHVAAFDIALQPRVTEYASPLKLFDYMAQARSIIAPDMQNITDVLTHEKDAFLFSPDSTEAFHEALNMLATDKERRDKLGMAANNTLKERDLTWAANAKRITAIAENLVRG